MIYKALASRPSDDIEVHVSYMEIYQEIGYDLLNTAARTNSVVTPFPKVTWQLYKVVVHKTLSVTSLTCLPSLSQYKQNFQPGVIR